MRLPGIFKIALKEDDAAGLKGVQHHPQPLRDDDPVKTHDEQLADLPAKFKIALGGHRNRRVYREEEILVVKAQTTLIGGIQSDKLRNPHA